MVQLGLIDDFKKTILYWDNTLVLMKYTSRFLYQYTLNNSEMRDVVIHTEEPSSTKKATEIMVKTLDSTYEKAYFEHIAANATQLNSKERDMLLYLLNKFEELFDGTLGEWYTETV